METMGVKIGTLAQQFAETRDEERIAIANRRSSEASKEARIARREAKSIKAEGLMYGAGIAD